MSVPAAAAAMKTQLYLALDQGGHASRALVFDDHGSVVAQAIRAVRTIHPAPDWVEQDPEELVASMQVAMGKVLHALGTRRDHVVNVGLATQRSSIVCWDKRSGAALSPIISWQDRRAHAWLSQFSAHADAIHKTTGLFLSAHYGASKLRWCLDHLPAVRAAHANGYLAFGPLAAFLVFRLTRERALLIDPANAARTLLWNLETLNWDAALLDLFGIPGACLPRCVPTRHEFGTLAVPGRAIPLHIVTGDQSAALFSHGRPQTDNAYINMGTGAFVQRIYGRYPGRAQGLLSGVVLQDADAVTYVIEGTVNGAGSALAWLQERVSLPDIEQHMPAWLQRTEEPPLFMNCVAGVGSPYWAPLVESRFIGVGAPWQQAVAVLESIVFLLQANLEEFVRLPPALHALRVSGGLTAYAGLCARLADLSGLRVYRPQVYEATARGTAWLLAACPSDWPEPAPGVWFSPAENPGLRARYGRWKQALHAAL